MIHELKCWPEYFKAVESGEKPFEIRKNDRPYKLGDTLNLREWNPKTNEYTGKQLVRKISYVLDMTKMPGNPDYLPGEYLALGLEDPRIVQLQKAFALACRRVGDWCDCPASDGYCQIPGSIGCDYRDYALCWQKYFLDRVDSEQVCRVCGCTQDNACPGGCYWIEDDLCSACAGIDEPCEKPE